MKKQLLMLGVTALVLGACGSDGEATGESAQDTSVAEQAVTSQESQTDTTADENTSSEESVEDSGDLPTQQPGDVIEAEGGTRTVVSTNYGINETKENGPFEVTVINAQVSQMEATDEALADLLGGEDLAMVSIELEVTNNSEDTNAIHPNQGTIVTNTGNQVDASIWVSDDVGGDFLGEVTKSGTVFFFYEGNPEEVENVRYIISSGHDENYESFGEDIEFSIDF